MKVLAVALCTLTLCACGSRDGEVSQAAQPVPVPEPVAYDFSQQDALSRFSALGPFRPGAADGACQAYLASDLSLRICSTAENRVTSLLATSRGPAGAAALQPAIAALAGAVAPDSQAADLRRIGREALEAQTRGETTLCPTTRCFKLVFLGDGWSLAADASS